MQCDLRGRNCMWQSIEHCVIHCGGVLLRITDEPKPATIAAGGDCRWPLGADGTIGVVEQVHPIAVPIANGECQARDAVIDEELMKRATADQHVDAIGGMLLIEHHALAIGLPAALCEVQPRNLTD